MKLLKMMVVKLQEVKYNNCNSNTKNVEIFP